jgi:hypothetical protein
VTEPTDAGLLAEQMHWAATTPGAARVLGSSELSGPLAGGVSYNAGDVSGR